MREISKEDEHTLPELNLALSHRRSQAKYCLISYREGLGTSL